MRPATFAMLVLLLLIFVLGVAVYPRLPAQVVSHWNAAGEVNGTMPRFWGVFLLPIISAAVLGLLLLVPRLDPLRENIAKFRSYYDGFLIVFLLFLLYLEGLILAWNLGITFSFIVWLVPAFAVLFYAAGVLTGHARRNWSIGIRTPWTISDEKVWERTHRLGGKLFKAAAILTLPGMLLPDYAILFVLSLSWQSRSLASSTRTSFTAGSTLTDLHR
jgi:uncharacterized membrane protein